MVWLPGMLTALAYSEVSVGEYYRPNDLFAPDINAARIALA
jgi:hypothetical protein